MHVDGDDAMLLTRDGRIVPVDLRSVPDMARALLTFGREGGDNRLRAARRRRDG